MQRLGNTAIQKLYNIEDVGSIIEVSAPGKLMLFGEYSVLYGKPCVVTAVEKRMEVGAQRTPKNYIQINAHDMSKTHYQFPKSDLNKEHPEGFSYVASAIRNFHKRFRDNKDINQGGLRLYINSQFGNAVSMGTSASVTTGVVGALRELYRELMEKPMSLRQLFDVAFSAHNEAQEKVGSGFDVASATFGGTLKYKKDGELIERLPLKPFTLVYVPIPKLRKKTKDMIQQIKKDIEKNPDHYQRQWDTIEQITLEGIDALKREDFEKVGSLMFSNHSALEAVGVSTPEATQLVLKSIQAGAYGAKMTGSYGDNIIALAPEEKNEDVVDSIKKLGYDAFTVKTGVEGVRREDH